jgi:probable rRNA maturation factor
MIKVNVEVNYKYWLKKIKNPKKYINSKLKIISSVIPFFKKKKAIFTILLTNSTNMKKFNKKFRKKNKSTDVLSFPNILPGDLKLIKENNIYIGDIAASYEIINKRSLKNNFNTEFDKVWVHGLLHLIGYDHIKNKDYYKMEKAEKKILSLISRQ